jgi:hypothetical protein
MSLSSKKTAIRFEWSVSGQHAQLFHRVKDLSIQELIAQFRIEAFAVAVFPGRARSDIQRSRTGCTPP